MSKVIVFSNAKGGVGKSSSSTALASILKQRGYRTLLIDCDTQCNSTDTFRAETEGVATVYDVLLDENRMSIAPSNDPIYPFYSPLVHRETAIYGAVMADALSKAGSTNRSSRISRTRRRKARSRSSTTTTSRRTTARASSTSRRHTAKTTSAYARRRA